MRGFGGLVVLAGCGRLGFGTAGSGDGDATVAVKDDGTDSDGTGGNATTVIPCSPD
jgi:hypothetical protein